MRFIFTLLFTVALFICSYSQRSYLDSLKEKLDHSGREDSSRVLALSSIADYYGFLQFDSCLYYAGEASLLSQKLNYTYGKFQIYRSMFFAYNCQGNYPKALEAAIKINETGELLKNQQPWVWAIAPYFIGLLNREMKDYQKAKDHFYLSIHSQQSIGEPLSDIFFAYSQMAILYANLNQLDSALWYAGEGYRLGARSKKYMKYFSMAIGALGTIHELLHHYSLAENFYRQGIEQSKIYNNVYFQARNINNLAGLYEKMGMRDSALHYGRISLGLCQQHNFGEYTLDASRILTKVFDSEKQPDSTLKYTKIMVAAKDSVFNQSKGQQFQQFAFNEIQRQQELQVARERHDNRIRLYILLVALSAFFLLAFFLYRNNLQKQKAKTSIERAYAELKRTQAQLVQREKMASLGELTAGIAHEIQNPLNFVNNFSEVNRELIEDLQTELNTGNTQEAIIISNDIKNNEQKIIHHGKRADAIVKGMLQHSRTGTGQRIATPLNALADEYLQLSYHGLRAKDKNFNTVLHRDFDEKIGNVQIVPEEMGRVLLNLYTNAFYSVNEKSKLFPGEYSSAVMVSTEKSQNNIVLRVKDNGMGIPEILIDKIFQPFFTTKPTGQGTGLGLSLSYDIIQAHGGELKVDTKEGEGAEFIITIPLT